MGGDRGACPGEFDVDVDASAVVVAAATDDAYAAFSLAKLSGIHRFLGLFASAPEASAAVAAARLLEKHAQKRGDPNMHRTPRLETLSGREVADLMMLSANAEAKVEAGPCPSIGFSWRFKPFVLETTKIAHLIPLNT